MSLIADTASYCENNINVVAVNYNSRYFLNSYDMLSEYRATFHRYCNSSTEDFVEFLIRSYKFDKTVENVIHRARFAKKKEWLIVPSENTKYEVMGKILIDHKEVYLSSDCMFITDFNCEPIQQYIYYENYEYNSQKNKQVKIKSWVLSSADFNKK